MLAMHKTQKETVREAELDNKSFIPLMCAIVVVLSLSWLASISMDTASNEWYRSLERSAYNPPGWAFGVVWPALYVMMTIAAWHVWRNRKRYAIGKPLAYFVAQLAINIGWTPIFFGMQAPTLALFSLATIIILAGITTFHFFRITFKAGMLMLPYMAWLCFAFYLNGYIVTHN
tara:strand:- start:470 stop:991 length:522 start_codon:yes stop_codon:yes gene_type:complete